MSNIGLERNAAENTQVDVNLAGVPFSVIPATSKARDVNNNIFSLDEDVTLDFLGLGGGVMTADVSGAIFVEANTLTIIISGVSGWETITNPSDGITGKAIETDPASKLRYDRSVKINAQSMLNTIESALLALTDVNDARVFENFEETSQINNGVTVQAKSIAASVLGGDTQEIAETLLSNKGTGVGFTGTTLVPITDFANNQVIDVEFFETIQIEIEIDLTIKTDSTFPADGIAQLEQNLVDFFNGEFTGCVSGNNNGFGVGEDVIFSQLFTPINAVAGIEVTSLLISRLGDTLLSSDVVINLNEKSLLLTTNIDVIKT